uniref:Uncharacterized protein n=1 Tax=Solanum lycopersicum TaxID=4081 RepID=A0A3Q7G5Q1_SOLLC
MIVRSRYHSYNISMSWMPHHRTSFNELCSTLTALPTAYPYSSSYYHQREVDVKYRKFRVLGSPSMNPEKRGEPLSKLHCAIFFSLCYLIFLMNENYLVKLNKR